MTIGVYCIFNKLTFKRYIGKSIKIEHRFEAHRYWLTQPTKTKDCNRHLYSAVQKYGIANFEFLILEIFNEVDDAALKDAELKWMDWFKTCDRKHGYNLRRDSSSQSFVHEETLALMSEVFKGEANPNYGNKWSDEQKESMRQKQIARHASGKFYSETWKKGISARSTAVWANQDLRDQMAANVSKAKTTHDFYQFNLQGELIKIYNSIEEVVNLNPEYKWQNIYAACNGNKPTHRGYLWARLPKKNSI